MRRTHRIALIAAPLVGLLSLAIAAGRTGARSRTDERIQVEAVARPGQPSAVAETSADAAPDPTSDAPRASERGEARGLEAPAAAGAPSGSLVASVEGGVEGSDSSELNRGGTALVLDPTEPGNGITAVTGHDYHGPRSLELWRIYGDTAVRVARTRSGPDGDFRFAPVVVPAEGVELVATPTGLGPRSPATSDRQGVEGPAPRRPHAHVLDGDEDGWWVRIEPGEFDGELVLADISETEFARFPIPSGPSANGRTLELRIEGMARGDRILIAQERVGGSRSKWTPVALEQARRGENWNSETRTGEGT